LLCALDAIAKQIRVLLGPSVAHVSEPPLQTAVDPNPRDVCAIFTESVSAIHDIPLFAPDAPIIVKIVAHLRKMRAEENLANLSGNRLRQKPWLKTNLVIVKFQLLTNCCFPAEALHFISLGEIWREPLRVLSKSSCVYK
jgi:hypothetical protein